MASRSSLLGDLLSAVVKRRRHLFDRSGFGDTPAPEDVIDCFSRLISSVGEASGIALARLALDQYAALDEPGKTSVLECIRDRYAADTDALRLAIDEYLQTGSATAISTLHQAAEPRRQELFRRLNQTPGGTADLVRLRADLLTRLPNDASFAPVDDDFRHLFSSWFNRGFLVMRRVDWNTSASVLERIIRYEAVHEISDWDELRRRVDAVDRRLYAFFHPSLHDEPLIFVEVALTEAVPEAIGPILSAEREELQTDAAKTAVFYAISNCQSGLRGVSFGSFLIKQVAEELRLEFSKIRTFVTLSPLPGLRRWLDSDDPLLGLFMPETLALMANPDGLDPAALSSRQQIELHRLVACYLLLSDGGDGQSVDPVCRFHLGNGAQLEQINLFADTSPRGLQNSSGVMVNYVYDLDKIESNHEDYTNRSMRSASNAVSRLIRGLEPDKPESEPSEDVA